MWLTQFYCQNVIFKIDFFLFLISGFPLFYEDVIEGKCCEDEKKKNWIFYYSDAVFWKGFDQWFLIKLDIKGVSQKSRL